MTFKDSFNPKPTYGKNTTLLFILLGLALGLLIEHFAIEPIFSAVQQSQIQQLRADNQSLNRENTACITGKNQLEQQLADCENP